MYTVNRSKFILGCAILAFMMTLMVIAARQVLQEGVGTIVVISGAIGFFVWPVLTNLIEEAQMMRRCRSQRLEYEKFVRARTQLVETLDELLENEAERSFMMPDGMWIHITRHTNMFSCRAERFIGDIYTADEIKRLRHSHCYAIPRSTDMPITMLYVVTDLSEDDESEKSDESESKIPLFMQAFDPANLVRLFNKDPINIATQVSAQELTQLNDELRQDA